MVNELLEIASNLVGGYGKTEGFEIVNANYNKEEEVWELKVRKYQREEKD